MASTVVGVMIFVWVLVTAMLSKKARGRNAAGKNSAYSARSDKWHREKTQGSANKRRPVKASDGHILKGVQDITCRQFGHNHPEWEEPESRYIVHDDPEDGFIILNGRKMRITEADQYENTI